MQFRIKRVSAGPPLARQSTSSQIHESTLPSKIRRVFEKVNLQGLPCLVQFWKCSPAPDSQENACSLTVISQPFLITHHHIELVHYRESCCTMGHKLVCQQIKVEDSWLAGRAVQTRVADQGTIHDHLSDHTLGLFVLPVFSPHKEFGGIIELVTRGPKRSFEEEFFHIHNLLKDEGLESKGMRKTIKVRYNNDTIKFTLSFSAVLRDLQKKVRKRFENLKDKTLSFKYKDTNGNLLPILSDHDLMVCLDDSVSNETTVIRMFVKPVS